MKGSKYLGDVIESDTFKQRYIEENAETWIREISLLSDIAVTQSQSAFSCFTSGYQHKLTYFMHTIAGCKEQLLRVDELIRHKFNPALMGGHTINDSFFHFH